jgi:hypothetical protein
MGHLMTRSVLNKPGPGRVPRAPRACVGLEAPSYGGRMDDLAANGQIRELAVRPAR